MFTNIVVYAARPGTRRLGTKSREQAPSTTRR